MINCKNKTKNTFSKYKQQFSDIKKKLICSTRNIREVTRAEGK